MRAPAKHQKQQLRKDEQHIQKLVDESKDKQIEVSVPSPGMTDDQKLRVLAEEFSKKLESMSEEEFNKYMEEYAKELKREKEEELKREREREPTEEEIERMRLADKGRREAQKRDEIENLEIKKYLKENPLKRKSFISDINTYQSLYVFCFGYAKLQSPIYQRFIKSLTDTNFCKVYIGRNRSLSKIIGYTPETELKTGLHEIGIALDGDDVGVLLTNKSKEEMLSKLREYEEFDFVKPGNTPMKTVVFEKDQVLPLPVRSNARKLFTILQGLNMPIKLIDHERSIQLTENYVVCEERERVTENAAKILKHLKMKLFNYVLVPVCGWTAATEQFEYYDNSGSLPTRS